MKPQPKSTPSGNEKERYEPLNEYYLVLFNDEHNKYEFVVESLIDICSHDSIQAEQCTFIAHHKGKCDIKIGHLSILENLKREFDRRGISTVICQN